MRNKPVDLANIYVRNDAGELIQLDNLITMEESSMPPQLFRYNRFVSATVSAALSKGYTLGQGIEEMDKIADRLLNPDDFTTTLSGQSKDFVESTSSLLFAFLLALLLIYLILSAQFESFRDPLIIMFTVPLALFGALLTLKLYGQTMNIFSQIGLIMLIGLVSKNGILMVEFTDILRAEGKSLHDAIVEAGRTRMTPVLLNATATILGMIPLAIGFNIDFVTMFTELDPKIYFGGDNVAFWGPLAWTIVFGLSFATFITLILVPVMYEMSEQTKARFKRLTSKKTSV